jgi:hypothetical protein
MAVEWIPGKKKGLANFVNIFLCWLILQNVSSCTRNEIWSLKNIFLTWRQRVRRNGVCLMIGKEVRKCSVKMEEERTLTTCCTGQQSAQGKTGGRRNPGISHWRSFLRGIKPKKICKCLKYRVSSNIWRPQILRRVQFFLMWGLEGRGRKLERYAFREFKTQFNFSTGGKMCKIHVLYSK